MLNIVYFTKHCLLTLKPVRFFSCSSCCSLWCGTVQSVKDSFIFISLLFCSNGNTFKCTERVPLKVCGGKKKSWDYPVRIFPHIFCSNTCHENCSSKLYNVNSGKLHITCLLMHTKHLSYITDCIWGRSNNALSIPESVLKQNTKVWYSRCNFLHGRDICWC